MRDADVARRLPTPVEDLVAAAGLVRGSDEIFAKHVLARAPRELRDAVQRLAGKVRAMLDRHEREIYVSPDITLVGRRNFQTLHEVGHERLPWQQRLAYADDDARLSWSTHIRFEREANEFAAEVLFQSAFFTEVAGQYAIGVASVVELGEMFGASFHATFRRYATTHAAAVCGVVIECSPCSKTPLSYRRHEAFASDSWKTRFPDPASWPTVLAQPAFPFLSAAAQARLVPTGAEAKWTLADAAGEAMPLSVELFSNSYRTLVLVWVPRRERLKRHPKLGG
jgi:IrrE N-terminal-like domain